MTKQTDNSLLKFSPGKFNAKLQQANGVLYSLSLSSGWSCPFAKDCLVKAVKATDKDGNVLTTTDSKGNVKEKFTLEHGKHAQFSCFSASQEVIYPSVRVQRQHNFDLLRKLRKAEDMADLIQRSMPKDATIIRIHVGGDFYTKEYMRAWFLVATNNPNVLFYAYTKSIGYWMALKDLMPSNFKMNGSIGGSQDNLIKENNLKAVYVVNSEEEAKQMGLEIDHTDDLAYKQDKSFALLIHGVQKKGTKAAKARRELQKANKGQYNREKIKQEMKSLQTV